MLCGVQKYKLLPFLVCELPVFGKIVSDQSLNQLLPLIVFRLSLSLSLRDTELEERSHFRKHVILLTYFTDGFLQNHSQCIC